MRAALVVLLLLARTAAADELPPYKPGKPDKTAVRAGEESNLDPVGGMRGFTFAISLAAALQLGFGFDEEGAQATGTGGGFSFRIGRVADEDTIILVDLAGTVYAYERAGDTKINQSTLLTIGAQTYVAPSLWLRAGAGVTSFINRRKEFSGDRRVDAWGGGIVAGAGLELIKRHSVAFGLELLTCAAFYRGGRIFGGGVGLSLGVY